MKKVCLYVSFCLMSMILTSCAQNSAMSDSGDSQPELTCDQPQVIENNPAYESCSYNKWNCEYCTRSTYKRCCRYVPKYYQKQCCRYVPQYYTVTCCRMVPEYYYICQCQNEPKCTCEKCTTHIPRYAPTCDCESNCAQ